MCMPGLRAQADFGRLWSCGDEMSSFNATDCCTTLCLKDSAQTKWAMSLQQTANLIIHRCLVYNSCGQNRKDPLFRRDCSRPTWRVIQVHSQDIPGLSNFNKERLLIRKYKYEIPGFSTWLNHIEPWKLWITQVFCDRKALKAISETVKRDEAKWGKPLHSRCRNQKLAIASNMRDIRAYWNWQRRNWRNHENPGKWSDDVCVLKSQVISYYIILRTNMRWRTYTSVCLLLGPAGQICSWTLHFGNFGMSTTRPFHRKVSGLVLKVSTVTHCDWVLSLVTCLAMHFAMHFAIWHLAFCSILYLGRYGDEDILCRRVSLRGFRH
jgi:hypothetical protein